MMNDDRKVKFVDCSGPVPTRNFWNPKTGLYEPRTIRIKNITIVCGQCGKDCDMTDEYVDLIKEVDGWAGRCPHCKGSNVIAFKIVRMGTESDKVRRRRLGGIIRSCLEEAYRKFGWSE